MNISEVAHLDVSQLPLREAAERLKHQEHDLVRELRAGSEPAFHGFVDLYQSKVRKVAYSITRSREDADDIAQQVFVKVYVSIKGFEGRSSLVTWLHRITVNQSFEFLRKRRATPSFVSAPSELKQDRSPLSADPSPASDTLLMQRDLISKLLQRLPEGDRRLILLREMEGYSIAELSNATGRTESALKARLFRIRRRLLAATTQISTGSLSRARGK
jgi:RNA polymerase sigma-70 factor (ECF subfamily)